MESFGKILKRTREDKKLSQSKLASEIGVHHSIIGRYEREEAKPTIDVVIKMAKTLDTTVGYLLGESDNATIFKNPEMLKRFEELNNLPEHDKNCILYTLDGLLQNVKTKQAYS